MRGLIFVFLLAPLLSVVGLLAAGSQPHSSPPALGTREGSGFWFHEYVLGRVNVYEGTGATLADALSAEPSAPSDDAGIPVFLRAGSTYYHPVQLSRYALSKLAHFESERDEAALSLAKAAMDVLLRNAERRGPTLLFPYRFPFRFTHGLPFTILTPPWYSALAQGQAVSALVRLAEATGDRSYLEAAAAAVRPLDPAYGPSALWRVDGDGYFWLEEYPAPIDDMTFNGYVTAMFGLYDWWLATAEPSTLAAIRASLTTLDHYRDHLRNIGNVSYYCLRHQIPVQPDYHWLHIAQLRAVAALSGDSSFAALADDLYRDGTVVGYFERRYSSGYRYAPVVALAVLVPVMPLALWRLLSPRSRRASRKL